VKLYVQCGAAVKKAMRLPVYIKQKNNTDIKTTMYHTVCDVILFYGICHLVVLIVAPCRVKGGKGSLRSGKRRALPLSHEVQRRPPCFLNSLSEESLGAAGSTSSPRLGQRFMSKWLSVQPLLRFNLPARAPPRTFTETVLQS